jgi:hypothetical protein
LPSSDHEVRDSGHDLALRKLQTRRGDYLVPHFDLWKWRSNVTPVAHILEPDSRICVVGSCFADQAVAYLRRRGYDAWAHPAGELYNAQSIRLELEHVFAGVEWPEDLSVSTPTGFTHRFRKRCAAASVDALRELDRQQTKEARTALGRADIVIVLAGTTTEVWRDQVTGLWANEIPEPSIYDPSRWTVDYGDLEGLRSEISRIQDLLARGTRARQVFSICPIPLYATWSDTSVIAANGRSKALLRTALDVELNSGATYLDLWDWVQAQSRWWTPMQKDGRHLRSAGVDRIMLFAERRLGADVASLPLSHRLASQRIDAYVAASAVVAGMRGWLRG